MYSPEVEPYIRILVNDHGIGGGVSVQQMKGGDVPWLLDSSSRGNQSPGILDDILELTVKNQPMGAI